MKYTQKRIDNTDCHIFEGDPSVGHPVALRSYGVQKVSSFYHGWWRDQMDEKCFAAINSAYFNSVSGDVVGGMYVDSGFLVSPFLPDAKFVTAIWEGNKLTLNESYDLDILKATYPNMEWAVQLGDPLVKDGKTYIGDGYFDHTWGDNPRTFIGQKYDGTVIFFATDGRTGDDQGFTRDELAQAAIDLECETAVMCDGGGSSTMLIESQMVNDNENRSVPAVFMWYAPEETPIEWINDNADETVADPTYEEWLQSEICDGRTWASLRNEEGNIYLDPDIWEWEEFTKSYEWLLAQYWFRNFTYDELACNNDGQIKIDEEAFIHGQHMQECRDIWGPMSCSSWGRTGRYGRSVGSSNTSQHFKIKATDITSSDADWKYNVKNWWKTKGYGGVGIYDTFIHLDSRGYFVEWWG